MDTSKISNVTLLPAVDLIKNFEGFAPSVYLCPAGKPTIGYGHVVRKGERFLVPLTRFDAEALLLEDLKPFVKGVSKLVTVPLEAHQFCALVSFTYNVGLENFRRSTLLRKINAGDFQGAAKEFYKWVYAAGKKLKGLEARRYKEEQLFTDGEY